MLYHYLHTGMHLRRCLPFQGTVWTLMVLVISEPLYQLSNALVVMKVHVLVFDTSPEPFHKQIIQCPTSAIHTNAYFTLQQLVVKTGLVNWLP
jgi:hypothetical protein